MDARKRRLLVAVAIAIAGGVLLFYVAGRFDLGRQMNRVVESVREAGPVPFFLAMALLPTVGFPLSPFTLAAGPVFGPTMGVGWVVVCGNLAIAFNVALTYWLAAWALRPTALWLVRRLGYELPEIQPSTAWLAIIVLRTVPVTPFCVQSILLGLARVPFGPYMLVSVLIPGAYATAVMVLGDALMRGDRRAIAAAVGMFVMVGLILHVVRKRYGRAAESLRLRKGAGGDARRV